VKTRAWLRALFEGSARRVVKPAPEVVADPGEYLSLEQAIVKLVLSGGVIGETAKPTAPDYQACRGLRFRLCRCSLERGEGWDYIARGPGGELWYVGVDGSTGSIYCGRLGFHFRSGTPPCIA
jgi:hypothetical protein